MTARPLILEHPLASDAEDVAGIRLAAKLHLAGFVQIIGVIASYSNSDGPAAADATLRTSGIALPSGAFGAYKTTFDPNHCNWPSDVVAAFTHSIGAASTVADAVVAYRTLLASRHTADLVIFSGGPLHVLNALLNSPADGISPLTGSQLVAASVYCLWCASGYWPASSASLASAYGHTAGAAEYNFLTKPSDAHDVVANWPTPIVFVDTALGDNVSLTYPTALGSGDVVNVAYASFKAQYTLGASRASWNEVGYLALALGPSSPLYSWSATGTAAVNASTGHNTFTTGAGNHRYVTSSNTAQMLAMTSTLVSDTANQALAAWPAQAAPAVLTIRGSCRVP